MNKKSMTGDFKFEKVTKKDVLVCARLVSDYLGEPLKVTKADIKDMLTWDDDEYLMVKAVTKLRQIIGFAAVINEKWNKTAAIEWIVLDPGFRGCGVGTQLLFHLHEYSIKHGARKIYVDTGSTSAGAINFYLANGYSAEAVLKDYYADGHDALWLSRRFKDSKIQKT